MFTGINFKLWLVCNVPMILILHIEDKSVCSFLRDPFFLFLNAGTILAYFYSSGTTTSMLRDLLNRRVAREQFARLLFSQLREFNLVQKQYLCPINVTYPTVCVVEPKKTVSESLALMDW